ncbi:hypothetical protein DRO69_08035 [Candidatus Bathyarchaeota archaeon]|nr:MAG: hypothetical protein DRO69_08035 [Candidatus Bathyarchaeota archaeon]
MDKMKFFSAFIRTGLENGDAVFYTYPDEESETVRAKLREYGINVEKYEKNGALSLETLTECFMSNGKFDFIKSVHDSLNWWTWAKRKGYKHARGIEDLGDLSFFGEQWSRYVVEYWQNPEWDDLEASEWVRSEESLGVVYDPFLKEITAINVEHMSEAQIAELFRTLTGKGVTPGYAWINLIENMELFSRAIGFTHRQLVGRKILLEFNPTSDYEKIVDRLAKEAMANVEPIFIFTYNTSPIHQYLAEQPIIRFFLTSLSTSIPKSTSKNTVLLPAKNTPLILDAISRILETYESTNVCFVFDILSELLMTTTLESTFTFMHHALDMLSSEKTTSLFLLNASAHDDKVVSRLRSFFSDQLIYDSNGLKVVKIS